VCSWATDGTFQQQQTYTTGTNPYGIAVGDFNGVGIPDLAVTNAGDNTVSVLLGNGDGTSSRSRLPDRRDSGRHRRSRFQTAMATPIWLSPTICQFLTVSVLLGNGNGTFQPQQAYTVGSSLSASRRLIFNGDGVPDFSRHQ